MRTRRWRWWRGFSDRPRVRYDAALFNRQIDDLLAALRIEGRVHLVGLASGGLQSLLIRGGWKASSSSARTAWTPR
jgi:hypothetical protein